MIPEKKNSKEIAVRIMVNAQRNADLRRALKLEKEKRDIVRQALYESSANISKKNG